MVLSAIIGIESDSLDLMNDIIPYWCTTPEKETPRKCRWKFREI